MLRFFIRSRFASRSAPEREAREAWFADSTGNQGQPNPQGIRIESIATTKTGRGPELPPGTSPNVTPFDAINRELQSRHALVERVFEPENKEKIAGAWNVLDALCRCRGIGRQGDAALREQAHELGILVDDNQHVLDAVAAWYTMQLANNTLGTIASQDACRKILTVAMNDPETLAALITELTAQSNRYEQLVQSLDFVLQPGARKKVTRYDTALKLQAIAQAHGQHSVDLWLQQASPDEIANILGESTDDARPVLKRWYDLLKDATERATFGYLQWGSATDAPPCEVQQGQRDYFEEVGRQIAGLKLLLQQKLQQKADELAGQLKATIRANLQAVATKAGIAAAARGDLDAVTAEEWDSVNLSFAKVYGVRLEEVFQQLQATDARITQAKNLDFRDSAFVSHATSLLRELENDAQNDLWQRALNDVQQERVALAVWIKRFQTEYPALRERLADDAAAEQIARMVGCKDAETLRMHLDHLAEMLRNPDALDLSEIAVVEARLAPLLPIIAYLLDHPYAGTTAIPEITPEQQEFSKHLEHAHAEFASAQQQWEAMAPRLQQSHACQTHGIPGKLHEILAAAQGNLAIAEHAFRTLSDPSHPETQRLTEQENAEAKRIALAQVFVVTKQMKELQRAFTVIDRIPKAPEDSREHPYRGWCSYGQQKIFVNLDRNADNDISEVFDHEFGHLVCDALVEHTDVLRTHFELMESQIAALHGDSGLFESLIETAARERWHMDRDAIVAEGAAIGVAGGGQGYYRRKRFEELLMQYASYRHRRDMGPYDYSLDADATYSTEERTLFHLLDRSAQMVSPAHQERLTPGNVLASRKSIAALDHDPNEAPAPGNTPAEEEKNTGSFFNDYFRDIRADLRFIGEFLKIYPQMGDGLVEIVEGKGENKRVVDRIPMSEVFKNDKADYERLFAQYYRGIDADTGERMADPRYKPENDERLKTRIRTLNEGVGALKLTIKKFDGKKLDSPGEATPSSRGLWLLITKDIQWLSIMDLWTVCKEGWEDVSRLWKRRGENARAKMGEALTGWISDRVPYLGTLKHEFHRREQASEQEAVGVWEKALENADSYKLIEDIEHTNNKDHLKAIINLLTKRGRLDWENEKLWNALNRFSHYKIPIHEVHRDPVLLDKWLQKVISDIWGDKDIYRSWKTSNEHNYNSERDKYNGDSDFLANAGKLGSQLEFQLRTFVTVKDTGETMPEFVNPHVYENMLVYAMTRGKMSMEAKFYYFVRGLEVGLIPFDRLSIINSQISTQQFPFIDYFYGRNNTLVEIQEIGASITEYKNGHQTFGPGPKTTAFLMEEVCKDEVARQRVFKVMDAKGNEIDHEDIPLMVAYATYSQLNNFLIPITGQRQRVTTEGIKNAYVGYNTLFKVHGMLAKKRETQHHLPLASSDVDFLVSRLVAYMHFDNIVVRQASERDTRPSISYENLENETMPSGNNRRPKEFRDKMNEFVDRVLDAYAINEDMQRYLGKDANGIRDNKQLDKGGIEAKAVFAMTQHVYKQLREAILADPEPFEQILKEMSELFINEGSDNDQLTFDEHKDIFDRRDLKGTAPNGIGIYPESSGGGGGGGGGGHHHP